MADFATPFNKKHPINPIKVFVRAKPLLEKQIILGAEDCTDIIKEENKVVVNKGQLIFTFDGVFNGLATQKEIFENVLLPALEEVNHRQVTVFAYGQTGSGKTYTMGMCPTYLKKEKGLLQQAITHLIEKEDNGVKLTFLEVYRERLFDLFSSGQEVEARTTVSGGIAPARLVEKISYSTVEALTFLNRGMKERKMASTVANNMSSRSHAMVTLTPVKFTNGADVSIGGCLRLVDLAGAEGVGRNNTEGKCFSEGVRINKDLLSVGKVLGALSSNSSYVPYRESIVTRLLQDSLSSGEWATMIACINPADLAVTVNTLRYAEQAKSIKMKRNAPSTVKRIFTKRKIEDVSASPSAYKKFKNLGSRTPHHNVTISTPGHRPPPPALMLNSTMLTPCNGPPDCGTGPSLGPLSSSRTDLREPMLGSNLDLSPMSEFLAPNRLRDVDSRTRLEDMSCADLEQKLKDSIQTTREISKILYKDRATSDNSENTNPSARDASVLANTTDSEKCNMSTLELSILQNIGSPRSFISAVAAEVGKIVSTQHEPNSTWIRNETKFKTQFESETKPLKEITNFDSTFLALKNFPSPSRLPLTSTVSQVRRSERLSTSQSDLEHPRQLIDQMSVCDLDASSINDETSFLSESILCHGLDITTLHCPPEERTRPLRRSAMVANEKNSALLKKHKKSIANNQDIFIRPNTPIAKKFKKRKATQLIATPIANNHCDSQLRLLPSPRSHKQHSATILAILNSTSVKELQKLPSIGPKTATIISNYRKLFGPLKKISDLQNIEGISKSFYTKFTKVNFII